MNLKKVEISVSTSPSQKEIVVLWIVCTVNHTVLQCMYRLILVYMCAFVGTIVSCIITPAVF